MLAASSGTASCDASPSSPNRMKIVAANSAATVRVEQLKLLRQGR